ncbi:hypothetical protein R5R35_012160 [Gryllus longicercus]|uniref:Kinesin motor domain-containing protein n=1 Tax=Gryllus longicercus TaxID=2509291 RepID=A0AAN9WBA8_9ORTH
MRKNTQTEHIKTFLRVRPLNDAEVSRASRIIVDCPSNSREVVINERPNDKITRKFTFDKVFGPNSKQIDVYKSVAAPLIKEVLDGYNCTIFAYGQTGAGKTYTMEGRRCNNPTVSWTSDLHAGIIPRAVGHLFDELRLLRAEYSVKASFLEIYNEEIFDLLSPVDDTNKLRLYDDAVKKGAVIVSGLDEIAVRKKEDVYAVLDRGSRKRQTAATLMNAASSRSHTVFSITVRIRENAIDDNELLRTGKLNLVDLAGSENIGRSGAIEKRAREAGNINQSLLTLGRVITALVEKTPHVPYRESKLTRLLQESLGGRTKTCIIATISPSQCNMEETLSTLDYAHRAKNIQNKPEVNQKIGKVALIQEYIEEIQRLKSDLTAAREKNGIYLAQDHYNEMMLQIDSQKRELSGLLNDVKTLTDTLERKEELNKELNESLQNYFKELQETKTSLEESKVVLQHHVTTEQKLFKQAEDLLSVADIATNDVNLLHDSLGRKRRIEANNLAACSSLTNTSKNKLSGLKELVSNFQEERLNSSHEILTICDKTKEVAELRSLEMKDSVDGALAISTDFLRTLQNCTKTLVSETGQKIENTKSECAEFFQHNTKDMVVFLEHIVHRFEKMSKEISIFRTEHQKVTEQLAVTIEEQDKKYLTFLESLNVHVNAMGVKLRDQEQILMDSKQTIIKQESEMEKVRAVFQSFFDEGSSGIKKLAKNVERSLSSVQMTTSDVNDVTMEMDSMKTSSVASSNNVKKFLDINKMVALPVVQNMESFGSEVCQEVSEQKSDFSEKQIKYLQNIHGNLDSVSEVLLNYQCDQEKEIQISEQNANNFTVTHTRLVEQTKDEQQKLIEKCENNVRCDKESVKAWSENAVQSISECDMMLEKFLSQDIMEDIPSGKTPQRRELVYPRELAATSPHERILCRFRAAKVTETLMESDQSIESSSFQAYQEPMMDSNTSYSARTALSESSLQGRERASSASSISCENSMLPSSCKSEPSIPYALLDKENSSQQAHFGIKSRGMKRPALTEHNE